LYIACVEIWWPLIGQFTLMYQHKNAIIQTRITSNLA